ncbi:MAG: transposase [Clostridiales bacterium]|jgi:transposase|nr:transposase [Clostridiales bacterium]
MPEEFVKSSYPLVKELAAGIDIASTFHVVAVPSHLTDRSVREFDASSSGLREMVSFLKECGIEEAAMEATSIYWVPVYNILEENGIKPTLLNPRSLKCLPGRKSDVKDSQWILKVFSHGFGQASFIPEAEIVELRELVRARESLIMDSTRYINLMDKNLRLMNINLDQAVSDISGESGMNIIRAIIGGQRDPHVLASLVDKRCKKSPKEIAKHLDGVYKDCHLINLKTHYHFYHFYLRKIKEYDAYILTVIEGISSKRSDKSDNPDNPDTPVSSDASNASDVSDASADNGMNIDELKAKLKAKLQENSLSEVVYKRVMGALTNLEVTRILGTDLTRIEGVGPNLALTFLSEVGTNVNAFPTEKHFASWLGLCPGCDISGGKVLSRRTRKVVSRLAAAFRMSALSARRSQSLVGCFYRKMRSRQGPNKAITSTAHKLATYVYNSIKYGIDYVAKTIEEQEEKQLEYKINQVINNAKRLGLTVTRPSDEAEQAQTVDTIDRQELKAEPVSAVSPEKPEACVPEQPGKVKGAKESPAKSEAKVKMASITPKNAAQHKKSSLKGTVDILEAFCQEHLKRFRNCPAT